MMILDKLKEMKGTREEGFTLIELLVVIVIIGVLAAIALPIFLNQQKAAADATLKSDIRLVTTMMETSATKGLGFSTAPYVDTTYRYVLKYNNGNKSAWPVMAAAHPTGKLFFSGAPDFNISEGSRISVKVQARDQGYCVAGANDGGNYNSSNGSDLNFMLYYDSVNGKLTDRAGIDSAGACSYFLP